MTADTENGTYNPSRVGKLRQIDDLKALRGIFTDRVRVLSPDFQLFPLAVRPGDIGDLGNGNRVKIDNRCSGIAPEECIFVAIRSHIPPAACKVESVARPGASMVLIDVRDETDPLR